MDYNPVWFCEFYMELFTDWWRGCRRDCGHDQCEAKRLLVTILVGRDIEQVADQWQGCSRDCSHVQCDAKMARIASAPAHMINKWYDLFDFFASFLSGCDPENRHHLRALSRRCAGTSIVRDIRTLMAYYGHLSLLSQWLPYIEDPDTFDAAQWAEPDSSVVYLTMVLVLKPNGMDLSQLFIAAVRSGLYTQVSVLLSHVDPSSDNSMGIRTASVYGHTDIVRLLLRDGRSNPRADGNAGLQGAVYNGHLDVVLLLLGDPRTSPDAFTSDFLLATAINECHTEIVGVILSRTCPRPETGDLMLALDGRTDRRLGIFRLLLEDRRADPAGYSYSTSGTLVTDSKNWTNSQVG